MSSALSKLAAAEAFKCVPADLRDVAVRGRCGSYGPPRAGRGRSRGVPRWPAVRHSRKLGLRPGQGFAGVERSKGSSKSVWPLEEPP